MKMSQVLNPIEAPFSPTIEKVFEHYPRGKDGQLISLFRVFANSLRFLMGKGVVNLLDQESPLSIRERELVILRVTANCDCEYEWGVHVSVFAEQAGFSREQIVATRLGSPSAACWSEEEALILHCVDDLCRTAKIQDPHYLKFQQRWSVEQQLEILALCGNYHTVSFVANTSRIPMESIGAAFPVPLV